MSQIASDAKISAAMSKLGMTAPLPNLDDSQVLKAILVALGNITSCGGGGGSGNVTGPGSAVAGHLAVFADNTGKVIADGGAVPTIPSTIVGIQSVTKTDVFTGNATSWTNVTTLTISVTTLNAADKVMLIASVQACSNNSNECAFLRIARDGNPVTQGDARGVRQRAMGNVQLVGNFKTPSISLSYLDAPGSVGTFVYTLQYILSGATTIMTINASADDSNATFQGTEVSTLTAMLYH